MKPVGPVERGGRVPPPRRPPRRSRREEQAVDRFGGHRIGLTHAVEVERPGLGRPDHVQGRLGPGRPDLVREEGGVLEERRPPLAGRGALLHYDDVPPPRGDGRPGIALLPVILEAVVRKRDRDEPRYGDIRREQHRGEHRRQVVDVREAVADEQDVDPVGVGLEDGATGLLAAGRRAGRRDEEREHGRRDAPTDHPSV